ncbi:alpha-2,8-sialyltransferase 8E-like [Lycodopsis pacificus]
MMDWECNVEPHRPPPRKQRPPWNGDLCKGCREVINKVKERYSQTWKKQEDNYQRLGSQLRNECHGFDKAIITQANTPVGTKLAYKELFSTFPKEHPFSNKIWDTCAVVGNGGILTNSRCGKMIDSAQFVMRCNLAPLDEGYGKDVGIKTDVVTANPSIFQHRYESLTGRRRPFVESLRSYGSSLLLLPTFNPLCMRAVYSIEDLESPIRPVFFNPEYLQNLTRFWRSQGLKASWPSTGIIMASLALEHCANVHLYGFWPFSNHPDGLYALTNHYYDDMKVSAVHSMPTEFDILLRLHSQGVLRLHLGDCRPGEK